jgi:hypothetical protein
VAACHPNKRATIAVLLLLPSALLAHPGNGIIALSATSVITGDAIHNGIWKFQLGKNPNKLTGGATFHCHWVTRGQDGNLYGETLGRRQGTWKDTAYRLDAFGKNPQEIASDAEGIFGIFAVGRSGEIIHQVGKTLVSWKNAKDTSFRGSKAIPEISAVTAFAWGPQEALFFSEGANVWQMGKDGNIRKVAAFVERASVSLYAGANGAPKIWGLTVDSRGRIWVALPSNGKVVRIDLDGSRHIVSRGSDGWEATGVAVFDEDVFLLESKTVGKVNEGPRVRIVHRNGRSESLGVAS